MTATVTRLRPRKFYTVVPGAGGGPGEGEPEPVPYEGTKDGLMSAMAHARLLSARGGDQWVMITEGRQPPRQLALGGHWRGGQPADGTLLPPAFPRPAAEDIRPGAPHGHIPEICTHAKNRAAGRTPRRSPNMPRPQWPGII